MHACMHDDRNKSKDKERMPIELQSKKNRLSNGMKKYSTVEQNEVESDRIESNRSS
jgi:hypothetical protein